MSGTAKTLATVGLSFGMGLGARGSVVNAQDRVRTGAVVAHEAPPLDQQEQTVVGTGFVRAKRHPTSRNGRWVWAPGHGERECSSRPWQDGRWEPRNGIGHRIEGQTIVGGTATVNNDENDRDRVRDHRRGGVVGPPVGATFADADRSRAAVQVGNGQVHVNISGPSQAPPPIRVESPGAARRGFVWINGNYEWRDNQYVWIPGHWERERAGQVWFDGRWVLQGTEYVWLPGEWRARGDVAPTRSVDRRTR